MIYRDSYQTTIGSIYAVKDVVKSLKELVVYENELKNDIITSLNNIQPFYLTGESSIEDKVPLFNHSIYFESLDKKLLATDLRLYVNVDKKTGELVISNKNEYNFAINRSKTSLLWSAEDYDSIKVRLDFAAVVYATLISDSVAKAFSLDFQDRSYINVAALYFYNTLFVDEITEDFKQLITHKILSVSDVKGDEVFRIIDELEEVTNIEAFCNKLKDIIESSRLNDFNLPVLLTLLKHSWYGINAKDYIAISLEYPPTWVALLYTILSEKTYKKTPIARLGEILGKRGKKDNFLKEFDQITDEMSLSLESLDDLDFEPI